MRADKPLVICIAGPTAVGKTDLAIDLLESFSSEIPLGIISVDSALVYRGMNIGTAKPDAETLARAPHRLIDIRDPWESYSAGDFCKDVVHEIREMTAAGITPLLVGGTMMYFHSLQTGLAELPEADPKLRAAIDAEAAELGWPALHDELKREDPESAARIQPGDAQRIQRALEVYRITGEPISRLQKDTRPPLAAEYINIGLMPADRSVLHERIARRFDLMLKAGFEEEVRSLLAMPQMSADAVSLRAVGYRQMVEHLEGSTDSETMRENAIVATRRLAKRQLTWLRSMAGMQQLEAESAGRLATARRIIVKAMTKTD